MFDIFKDLAQYRKVPPYASEHYGVYQPLLGWESKLTKKWVQRGGVLVDPLVKHILDGRVLPGPTEIQLTVEVFPEGPQSPGVQATAQVLPLEPGSEKSPYKVALAVDLKSGLLDIALERVQTFVDNNEGRLPDGGEWAQVLDIDDLMDDQAGAMVTVSNNHWARLSAEVEVRKHDPGEIEELEALFAPAGKKLLEIMQYESQIATFLILHAQGHDGYDPNELQKLFSVQVARSLRDILQANDDPLANIDPKSKSGVLSPVGFVHLFRQYFFDLGTFLGESVEHIWLAPGTTIELVEVSTRKTIIERSEESAQESTTRAEESTSIKDELSDAVKSENGASTKLGVSTTHTVNYGVYQGTATASFGAETTRKEAREQSHKESREQTEKLSTEIKRSFKSVFKTVTETTDTRSRRYVLQNPGPDLINYELRRKMRRVGVQMQDLGTRLCWQVFIDDAGATLGLAELVHFAGAPDLPKEPEVGPPPTFIKKKVSLPIPFRPTLDYSNWHANYELWHQDEDGPYKGQYIGLIKGDSDDDQSNIIMGPFHFKFDPPHNYCLKDEIRILGPQGNKQAIVKEAKRTNEDGQFDVIMQFVNFGSENSLMLDAELIFEPLPAAQTEYETALKLALEKYDAAKRPLVEKAYKESVRQRIKDASNIKPRPSWNLREEERTIVYRKLVELLMLDSWKLPDTPDNRRLSHVRSEVIRTLFDVDAMLYFVAPEWWMPRRHQTVHNQATAAVGASTISLTDDPVKWADVVRREDNYLITEESSPARLGSSLGWLLQLDGDNLRNAFLNAPWVKAVIPIRPGRERAALNWLRAIEGAEKDGWDSPYTAFTVEDDQLVAELAGEGKAPTIGNVLEKIAEQMEKDNGDIQNVLEADKVFEYGFDHLAGGFNADKPANQVFSQSITILPTDQIVAMKYEPAELSTPDS